MRAVLGGQKTILINQSGINIQKLSDLTDVDTAGVQDGYIIYYDAASMTYKVSANLNNQRIDGGVF